MTELVNQFLNEDSGISEASVYLPPRGSVWVGVFSGPVPGIQIRKSTGTRDKETAMAITRQWEAEARAERLVRPKQQLPRSVPGGLSQKEIAALLQMSERAVRNIEKRALAKLRQHPAVRQLWDEYSGFAVKESENEFTKEEVVALLGMTRTPLEKALIRRLIYSILFY